MQRAERVPDDAKGKSSRRSTKRTQPYPDSSSLASRRGTFNLP
jgi:hypothetical protein